MAPEQPDRFACTNCGANSPRARVSYDALGYPLCPRCGAGTRPRSASERSATVHPDRSRTADPGPTGASGTGSGGNWQWVTDGPAD